MCFTPKKLLEKRLLYMELIEKAVEFEQRKHTFKTTSERIEASREVKDLILSLNDVYKVDKDQEIMDLMKRLTAVKQKIEKRLKGRP
ncbi:hypothetical protein SAMN04489722_101602 [Algibacter lectus]|nr:hypothetical protein SAMN04489722_101602 [Algibacter lectus]